MVKPINDKILSQSLMHSHFVDRYAEYNARQVKKYFEEDIIPDIMAQIQRFETAGIGYATQRQKEILKRINRIINDGYGTMSKDMALRLREFGKAEATYTTNILNKLTPIGIDFTTPNLRLMSAIVSNDVWQGATFAKHYNQLSSTIQFKINAQIKTGMTLGEDIPTLAARVRGTEAFPGVSLKTAIRYSEGLARTSTHFISGKAREATYKENEDLLAGVQWISALDGSTCEYCGSLDGEIYDVGKNPEKPAHINCPCDIIPALKTPVELGLKGIKAAQVGTRLAKNSAGKFIRVSEKVTYEKWLKGQSQKVVREALGKTKAQLWQRGMIKLDRMSTNKGRILPLKEIYKRENILLEDVM